MSARAELDFLALISEGIIGLDENEAIADVYRSPVAVGPIRHGDIDDEAMDEHGAPDLFGRPLQSRPKGGVTEAAHL